MNSELAEGENKSLGFEDELIFGVYGEGESVILDIHGFDFFVLSPDGSFADRMKCFYFYNKVSFSPLFVKHLEAEN